METTALSLVNSSMIRTKDGTIRVSSRKVSEAFEKRHDNVLRDLEALDCSADFRLLSFEESSYVNEQGKLQPEVLMTRDGFMFLTMGFRGAKAAAVKEAFIKAFNEYEQAYLAQSLPPAKPVSVHDLLEMCTAEISRNRLQLAAAKQELSDAKDWIIRKDAWHKVEGYSSIPRQSDFTERRMLNEISQELGLPPRTRLIQGSGDKVYKPKEYHQSVWKLYVSRVRN